MNKEYEPQEIWIECNIELADWVYATTGLILFSQNNTERQFTCVKASPSMMAMNETRFPSLSLKTSASCMNLLSTCFLASNSPAATTKVATQ